MLKNKYENNPAFNKMTGGTSEKENTVYRLRDLSQSRESIQMTALALVYTKHRTAVDNVWSKTYTEN